MRKITSTIGIAALCMALTACGTQTEIDTETKNQTEEQAQTGENALIEYADTTINARVSSIDGTTVTVQIGEGRMSGNMTPPDMDNQERPEDADMTPPEKTEDMGNQDAVTEEIPEDGESIVLDLSAAEITKDAEAVSASEISEGDMLRITFDEKSNVKSAEILRGLMENEMPGERNDAGNFGGSSEVTQGTSANTITQDGTYSDNTYNSTGDDENALRVDGATVTLEGISVDKSEGATSNTENGDFYGVNAALLATNGAEVTIRNAYITSTAQNGNGVFSYGSGTSVSIYDSTITTSADNSGGIQTTGGGTTNAYNLTVNTAGNSSAAIRSDRGGGNVYVEGGTYTSNGYNSPAVYSTADITVLDAQLTANNSEALVIEGKNSIVLENCDVTGNMSDTQGTSSDENVHNVMIYQSMSGDADVGTSEFSMTGGTLTALNGDMIYVTNTHCIITLSGVKIVEQDPDGYLLRVVGNSATRGWGTAGSNGAQVEFTAAAQELDGDIIVDTISTLTMTLRDGSLFNGTINIVENEEGGEAVSDNAVVTIEEGCTWNLTGDCTITKLVNNGTVNLNGYTITLDDGTVLR